MRVDSSSSQSVEVFHEEPQATSSVAEPNTSLESSAAPRGGSDSVESYRAPHDNAWVQAQKQAKQVYEGAGVHALERADEHSRNADKALEHGKAEARAAFQNGHLFDAMGAMTAGVAGYVGHTAGQASNTVVGLGASVGAGLEDVAMGDKKAIQKVAVGGAAIATAVTANPMVGLNAYEAINALGRMTRAESKGEFAVGAIEIGLAMGGDKLLEKAAAPIAKAAIESSPALTRATSELIQGTFGLPAGEAAEHLLEHGLSHAIAMVDEKIVKRVAEKTLMPAERE